MNLIQPPSGLKLLGAGTLSGASATIAGLAGCRNYILQVRGLLPATDAAVPFLRTGTDGSFSSGASDYLWAYKEVTATTPAVTAVGDNADSEIELCSSVDNVTNDGFSGVIDIMTTLAPMRPQFHWRGTAHVGAGGFIAVEGGGERASSVTFNQVQLLFSTGNISAGEYTLWGCQQ